MLEEAIRIGNEAELEARDIKINLDGQSRQLQNANDNVFRMNGELTIGSRLINKMKWHQTKNKLLIY